MKALTSQGIRGVLCGCAGVVLLCCCAGIRFSFGQEGPGLGGDKPIRTLLAEMAAKQPKPYGLPDRWTYNYGWAQYALAFLAAERCGYLPRAEAIERIGGLLDETARLERHHGFWFDGYDLATGKPTSENIYFQGWWIYALQVLREAYDELAPRCSALLAGIDYENSGMFNPTTRTLAADYRPVRKEVSAWIDLYGAPSGEMRTPYIAYTLLTGDISPWTRPLNPTLADLEGHPYLYVWRNFVFCPMLVHSVFLDDGYFARSWDEMLAGLKRYRRKNGMTFYPTRAEPLDAWPQVQTSGFANIEHRIAKPWQAWLVDPESPVMEKAYSAGHGVSLYCDNLNLYWSVDGKIERCELPVGTENDGRYRLPFTVDLLPETLPKADPVRLKSVRFSASRRTGEGSSPLRVRLNGEVIDEIPAHAFKAVPRTIVRHYNDLRLRENFNVLEFTSSKDAAYDLYRRQRRVALAAYARRVDGAALEEIDVIPPDVEVVLNGQVNGGENPFALLARCAAVHGYYPWHELKDYPDFPDRTVAWVGSYCDRVSISRVIHNVSDEPVVARFRRPAEWENTAAITVRDVTDPERERTVGHQANRREVRWTAEPRHTYRVGYAGKK